MTQAMVSKSDSDYMAMAIDLAKKGRYTTRPNPCVGCVIVKDTNVVGSGYHKKAGGPHAEVLALKQAKEYAKGATAYVTLEPCSHYGRTPPCAKALIEAGVSRVVVASLDPNPKVAGKGVAMLTQMGIEVTVGVLQAQAQALNVGFFKAMMSGLPYVRLKMAVSLDGRVAMQNGESKWITGQESRQDVQRLRAMSAAIITGSGTIIADNPRMTVRIPIDDLTTAQLAPTKLVVMDRSNVLAPYDYQALDDDTLFWHEDIGSLLQALVNDYECYDVLVESGSSLASAFLVGGWIDELIIYQAPCLLGATARPMFCGGLDHLCERLSYALVTVQKIGNDVRLTLRPQSLADEGRA